MTENEYSIKPLSNLPNITRLNRSQDGKNQNKKKYSGKQPNKKSKVPEINEQNAKEEKIQHINDLDGDGIDFSAEHNQKEIEMEKKAGHILKSEDVKIQGSYHLDIGTKRPKVAKSSNMIDTAAPPQVCILEENQGFAIIEITCSCGSKSRVRCEFKSNEIN